MSDRTRSLIWLGGLVAAAVVLATLVFGHSPDQDRVESLGQRIKCPVCQGESIGDSPAQMARDMMAVVEERVIEGRSDQEIVDELLASYSGAVLLDPPASGATLLLWIAPALAVLVGIGVILWWRRQTPTPRSETPKRNSSNAVTIAGLVLAFGAIVLIAGAFIQERGGAATGAAQVDTDNLDDVSNETLEAVIAANLDNPQIGGMRLALAERYFEAGNYGAAFPHYLAVAETDDPPGPSSVVALTRLGWMAWDGNGEAEAALLLFDEALEVDVTAPATRYLKARVLWCGANQPDEALELFAALLDDDAIDDESRDQVRRDIEDIESGTSCA